MKTKNVLKIVGLLITLFFVACRGGSTPATTYTYYPSTSTSTSTTSTSTGNSDPCPNPLVVSVTSLTSTPYVNQPVQFRTLVTGRCGTYKQTTQTASGFFTSTYDFSMTFTTVGSQTITVSVDAYNQAQTNIVETKTAQVTINVQNPPPSGYPPTCMITRNGYVVDTGASLPIIMTATSSSAIADVKINEQPAALNVTIPLLPNPLGSRFFSASGKVTDVDGRIGTCNLAPNTPFNTFEAPTTDSVRATSITTNSVVLEARIHGPVGRGALNGVAIPYGELPTGGSNLMTKTIVPPGPGKYIPRADVYNDTAYGADHGSAVGPEYCVPNPDIAATGDVWSAIFAVNNGYTIPSNTNQIMAGRYFVTCDQGGISCWRMKTMQRNFNQQLKTADVNFSVDNCGADRVAVGSLPTSQGSNLLYCAKLVSNTGGKVSLINPTSTVRKAIRDNMNLVCNPGQVMTGQLREYVPNVDYYLTLYCATPVWQNCQ